MTTHAEPKKLTPEEAFRQLQVAHIKTMVKLAMDKGLTLNPELVDVIVEMDDVSLERVRRQLHEMVYAPPTR